MVAKMNLGTRHVTSLDVTIPKQLANHGTCLSVLHTSLHVSVCHKPVAIPTITSATALKLPATICKNRRIPVAI